MIPTTTSPPRWPLLALALPASLALAPACTGEGAESAAWHAERDTVGDMAIVRTTGGSTWDAPRRLVPELAIGVMEGEDEYLLGSVESLAVDDRGRIYVYDSQATALRVYDADGRFVRTIGRSGEGPGEYKQPDAGLAVLADGRILLRDPGNGRIHVYSPSGEFLDAWPIRPGYFTSIPLFTDRRGHVYAYLWRLGRDGEGRGLIERSPRGEPLDTLSVPAWDHDVPTVSASTEGASQTWRVPFSPTTTWTWSPEGYFVGGVSTRYAIDLFRPGESVLRIERRTEPVPVTAGEKAAEEHRVRQAMRRLDPSWRWNGPPIPDVKPPFRELHVGRDGRLWVLLHAPGEEEPERDSTSRDPGEPAPPRSWTEPVLFDVFEPDGRYLGQVHGPDGMQTYPRPVLDRERVWAVVTDPLGVQQVVRFAIRARLP